MAHQLTINRITGKAEMFYVGETPWHSLGTQVPAELTGREARKAAGLLWEPELVPLYTHRMDPLGAQMQAYPVDGFQAVLRNDTKDQLGVVNRTFTLMSNEALFDFGDALVGEAAAMYHTAGSLRGGARVWALAKMPKTFDVVRGDAVEQYILLANGHDGSLSFTCRFTNVRVVCQNTLSAALNESGAKYQAKLRHTKSLPDRAAEARKVLGMSLRYFEVVGKRFQAMAAKEINAAILAQYMDTIFPLAKPTPADDLPPAERAQAQDEVQEERAQAKRIHEAIAYLFENGRGNQMPGVRGTVWAAYNAVTEYVDHVRGIRLDGTPRQSWAESALFGNGDWHKGHAFDAAMKLV